MAVAPFLARPDRGHLDVVGVAAENLEIDLVPGSGGGEIVIGKKGGESAIAARGLDGGLEASVNESFVGAVFPTIVDNRENVGDDHAKKQKNAAHAAHAFSFLSRHFNAGRGV